MAPKVIVVKSGYNALTETNPDNLIFTSDYNTLKYFVSGDVTVTVDYADYYMHDSVGYYHRKVTNIAHGLSYRPFFVVFTEALTNKFGMCPFQFADAGAYSYVQAYVDDTNLSLVVEILNGSSSGSIAGKFSYKIFKNNTGL